MNMPAELIGLRDVSARIGANMHLVQGAGGNTSIKIADALWVKASGLWLSDAQRDDIFVAVDLAGARQALANQNSVMPVLTNQGPAKLRPSIETSLHALMAHKVVLHVHAVNTIAWAVRTDGDTALSEKLTGLSWAKLPYHRPGLPLSQAIAALTADKQPDVLILGNHGLLVGGPDVAAAEALMQIIEQRLQLTPRAATPADIARLEALCAGTDYRPAVSENSHMLATDSHNLAVATAGSLYPDHVVFLGPALPQMPSGMTVPAYIATFQDRPAPVAFLVPGAGALVRKDITRAAEAMLECLGLVISRLPIAAPIRYLPQDEEMALLDWDAERYRKQLTDDRKKAQA